MKGEGKGCYAGAMESTSSRPFREVKRALSGEERVYDCEQVAVSARLAVVRFVFAQPLTAGGITFPAGGMTLGFFWRDRHYNLYHMLTADGGRIADRFDVIDHVRIRPDGVRYDDLLLDVWRYADGRIAVEDEDEVREAVAAGRLSRERQAIIDRTRRQVVQHAPAIVERALLELRHEHVP